MVGQDADVCVHCGANGPGYLDCVRDAKIAVLAGFVVIQHWGLFE
jgi:hypothetical protein